MRRATAAAATALAALAVGACGGDEADVAVPVAEGPTRTVERTTRVEVIRRASGGAFDPQRIYAREAPGVVTVFSEFSGEGGPAEGGEGGGGQLEGERQAVEPRAHRGDVGRGLVGQREAGRDGARALDEQLHGLVAGGRGRVERGAGVERRAARARGRVGERRRAPGHLALGA